MCKDTNRTKLHVSDKVIYTIDIISMVLLFALFAINGCLGAMGLRSSRNPQHRNSRDFLHHRVLLHNDCYRNVRSDAA